MLTRRWQFLMDEKLSFKRTANVTAEQAATLGVGLLVSCVHNPKILSKG